MVLFDTHAHLDDPQLEADWDGVLARARQAGVRGVLAVGTTAESSRKCVELAGRYPEVYAAVGIQPNCCSQADSADWQQVVDLAGSPKVVALGETGLDRYWDYTPFGVQQDYFQRHIRLSQQSGLPLVIHMRDCGADIVDVLRQAQATGPVRGVMHSFTGDVELADRCLALGLYISFAGMVTYKKSEALRQVAARIPQDRLLIETDAPYLSPHPKRGQRPNEPALLVHTARCLAELRGVELERLAEQTTHNALRLLGLGEGNVFLRNGC